MFTPPEIHLVFNHIPVIGLPFCLLLVAAGVFRKNQDLLRAGYLGFLLVALLTIPAMRSGGPAAKTLFMGGAPVLREVIHLHAEAAERAYWVAEILGLFGLFGLFVSRRPGPGPKILAGLTLIAGLMASVAFARVAHLGGLIRHPEVVPGWSEQATSPSPVPSQKKK